METPDEIVARNVRRLREERRHTVRSLSARLSELGRPILPSGITKIEDRSRRVDVGDLVALAEALEVSPVTLLMPAEPEPGQTAVWKQRWRWMHGEAPLSVAATADGQLRAVEEFRRSNRPYEDPKRVSLDHLEYAADGLRHIPEISSATIYDSDGSKTVFTWTRKPGEADDGQR